MNTIEKFFCENKTAFATICFAIALLCFAVTFYVASGEPAALLLSLGYVGEHSHAWSWVCLTSCAMYIVLILVGVTILDSAAEDRTLAKEAASATADEAHRRVIAQDVAQHGARIAYDEAGEVYILAHGRKFVSYTHLADGDHRFITRLMHDGEVADTYEIHDIDEDDRSTHYIRIREQA